MSRARRPGATQGLAAVGVVNESVGVSRVITVREWNTKCSSFSTRPSSPVHNVEVVKLYFSLKDLADRRFEANKISHAVTCIQPKLACA